MAITDIPLQRPMILIQQISEGLFPVDTEFYSWGIVVKVYETSDKTVVGDYIVFRTPEKPLFTISAVKYYIVNENADVSFSQEPPP